MEWYLYTSIPVTVRAHMVLSTDTIINIGDGDPAATAASLNGVEITVGEGVVIEVGDFVSHPVDDDTTITFAKRADFLAAYHI